MAMLEVVAHLKANADNMVSGFRQAQGAADNFGQSVQRQSGVVQRGFGIMSKAAIVGGGMMQTAMIMGAKMGIGFAMANEQAIISFKTLLGSQEKAEAMFKDLQEFAASTPFEFPQLRDAASKLLTTGVAAERVKPILTAIGDSTAAMGTGAEGIAAATRALQQMNLVGKVTGQDMMQLANAGIPAWDALAAAAKMSVAEVKKATEKGTLQDSVGLLMSGLENYSGEAMGRVKGMMAEQANTLTGLMSTLKDNINIALGEMMAPATEGIKDAMPAINDAIGKTMKSMAKPINEMVQVMMDAFQKLIPALEPMMNALSTIMVAVVSALVPMVAQLATALPSLQPVFVAIGQAIGDLSVVVAPLITQFVTELVPVIGFAATAVSGLTGFIAEHRGALEALTPVVAAAAGAYLAFKAVGKINALFGSAKQIWALVTATLAKTAAVGGEAAVTSTAAAAQAALAVAQASAMVAAGGGAAATAAYTAALAAQQAATASATAAQTGLNVALISNPIGLVIAAVVALVVAVVVMWKKFDWFRRGMKGLWNSIVSIVQTAINLILGYYEFWINAVITGVNLIIKAWNKIPWNKDIEPLNKVNLQLDITGAKVDNIKKGINGIEGAATAASQTINGWGQNLSPEMIALMRTSRAGNYDYTKNKPTAGYGAGAGGDTGGANPLQKLIDATKKVGADAVSKAESFFKDLTNRADDFAKSIKSSMMAVWSFSNAMSDALSSQKDYQEALNNVAEAEQAVAQAMSTRDMAAYSRAIQDYAEATDNLASAEKSKMTFMQSLKKQYEDAKRFGEILTALRKANLNEAGIAQIVAAGAEAGTKIGEEILAGGESAISDANTWYNELLKASNDAANAAKDQFYAQGLSQGEQLVKGITDAAKKMDLRLTSKGMTKAQIEKLQKNFSVNIGFSMTSLSELATPMAKGGIVRARSGGTLALLGEAGRDEAVIPLGKGGNATGNTYHITVQAGIGDEQEIARQLIKVLQSHEKRVGRLPLKVM
jgi:tape measure domain-containing protein